MNVFELAAKLTLDTSEYTKGLDGAEQSASGFGSKLSSGLGTAAKVGGAALAAVGTAAVAMGGAVAKGVSNLAEYGDTIDKQSQKMGMSAQAYQEWDAILQHSGTSIDAMTRGMTTLAKAAENDTAAFEALGLSQEEVASMNQEELFAATIKGLQGMEEGTERTVMAQKLLGGAAKELGPLLNTSAEETEAMRQRVHELGGVLSDEAVKNSAAFQDSLQDLKTTISGAKNQLLSEFLPAATQVMDGLTDIFSGNSGGMEKIKKGITDFVGTLSEKLPKFIEAGVEIAGALIDGIAQNLPSLIQSLVDSLVTLLPILIQGAIKLVAGLVAALPQIIMGLIEAIPDILTAIVEGFAPIVEQLGELFGLAWEAIKGVFAPIGDWFSERKEDVQNAFAAVDSWFDDKFQAARDFVHTAWEAIGSWFSDRWNDISTAFAAADSWFDQKFQSARDLVHSAWSAIGSWFSDRWSDIQNAMNTADSWFSTKFTDAKDAVHTAWTDIGTFFSDKWQEIQDVFADAWDLFRGIGGNIVQGLIQGIGDWIESAVSKARELVRRVIGGANSEAGVASPSKVFMQIGRFLDEGLAKGIALFTKTPVASAREMIDKVIHGADLDTSSILSNTVTGSSGVSFRGSSDSESSQPIILQVLLDGKIIGETSYNYMKRRTRMVGA